MENQNNDVTGNQLEGTPVGKFTIAKETLIKIASSCQERNFCEEVDLLEQYGKEEWLLNGLHTDAQKGLNGNDLEERNRAFGNNKKPVIELKSFIELLLNSLEDFTLRILLVAAISSIIIDEATAHNEAEQQIAWVEGFSVLVAVFVCAMVTAVNDYQKERQFQKLNSVVDERKRLTVIRNYIKIDIHQSEVMVGDVIQIFEGMEIPADSLALTASELSTDESAMTGEADPMKKDIIQNCIQKRNDIKAEGGQNSASRHDVPSPILLSGTRVLNGEGTMVVIVVGDNSCVGKIQALLRQDDPEATPLQQKLEGIAEDIGYFGLYSAIMIVLAMLIRFAVERGVNKDWDNSYIGEILQYFILGVTVIVVAIPEGLPLAVTLSLAYSTKKMLMDSNLVRKMAACETMGGANMICSDKTGTLTQNKMSLVNFWNEEIIEIDSYSQGLSLEKMFMNKEFVEVFVQSAIVNGTAMLRPEPKGSKTEIALLEFYDRTGNRYEDAQKQYPMVLKFPFSSKRKRMTMVVQLPNGRLRVIIKGASEIVFAACKDYVKKSSFTTQGLDTATKAQIEQAMETMADKALRTISIAYKDVQSTDSADFKNKDAKGVYDVELSGFTLVGVLGIKDILRQEVPQAVAQCKKAGIKVRMVTGDNKLTARAIARECGIIEMGDPNSIVMEGPEFIQLIGGVVCTLCKTVVCDCPRDSKTAEKLGKTARVDTIANSKEFDRIYPNLDVLARSRPEDKYALVTGLIERGHVVAVTGDGTNDAPALKKADVGFAMGIAGTEVAREAADIILLDDNFSSIVKAVMWGRNVYDAIKKFLQFQLTVNVVAVVLTLVGAIFTKQDVLTPIQMLWVNLIMDTFASLALATEPPTIELLNRLPHNRDEYIVTKKMAKHILGQAIYQLIILIIIVFSAPSWLPEYQDDQDTLLASKTVNGVKVPVPFINYKYSNLPPNGQSCDYSKYCTLVGSGRRKNIDGSNDYSNYPNAMYTPSRHYTFIFNTFVMMQLGNFFNARKLMDEINVFEKLMSNYLFYVIILITTFGSLVFSCYGYFGLTIIQWLISIAFGIGSLVWSVFLKCVREEMCCETGKNEVDPAKTESKVLTVKRSQEKHQKRMSLLNQPLPQQQSGSHKIDYQPLQPN